MNLFLFLSINFTHAISRSFHISCSKWHNSFFFGLYSSPFFPYSTFLYGLLFPVHGPQIDFIFLFIIIDFFLLLYLRCLFLLVVLVTYNQNFSLVPVPSCLLRLNFTSNFFYRTFDFSSSLTLL